MADDRAERRLAMHDAFLERGFRRVPSGGVDVYEGTLSITSDEVPVTVLVPDLDFVIMPLVHISESWQGPDRRLPHLGPSRLVCYYAQGSVVLDRYDPGGTIVRCVEQAARVLDDAVEGRSDADFGEEFDAHWSSRWMLCDLPAGYSGPATIIYPRLSAASEPTPVLVAGPSWLRDRDPPRRADRPEETALVVFLGGPLTLDPERKWPPADYDEFVDWLRWADPALPGRLEEALSSGSGHQKTLAIRATNGTFACRITVPAPMRTAEFLVNRRPTLARNLARAVGQVSLERITADSADLGYIYGRNLGSRSGLAGRSVAVVGCGTIGGFLAQQLAQCGAGTGGGRLLLVDTDDLRTANLGRHLLGVPFLHCNKAEACARYLNVMMPGAKVEWSAKDAQHLAELQRFDLVVDATGEEALSLALNQAAVDRRPSGPALLFTWLIGNGAAAQCILVDSEAGTACLKCLKPELAGEPLHPVMRPGVEVEFGAVESCADGEFVIFPVSRSVAARRPRVRCVARLGRRTIGPPLPDPHVRAREDLRCRGLQPRRYRSMPSVLDGTLILTPNGVRLVAVHSRVVETIKGWVESGSRSREAGGILIGSYRGDHVEVSACTVPMRQDTRARTLFDRMDGGHQDAAMRAWRSSGGTDTYVGEWHTHPEAHPSPSLLDRWTWGRIMRRSREPVVFAIGGWDSCWWGLGIDARVGAMRMLSSASNGVVRGLDAI